MRKKLVRYFYGFIDAQERFINHMASEGWRLVATGRFTYEFEPCSPGAYQYCVDFVGHKSTQASKDYQEFLKEMNYQVMTKPININYSFGKIRLRPWGESGGKVATTPGAFNKELLIVERENTGEPFKLHTSLDDNVMYYRKLRAAWGFNFIFIAAISVFLLIMRASLWKVVALVVIALLHLWPAIKSHTKFIELKAEADVVES